MLASALVAAGCATSPASSGALGPCGEDARSVGGYPELEAALPRVLLGRAPDKVDSGRNCSEGSLGTLATHGIGELRFAGATWEFGDADAVVIAILATPAEEPTAELEWIEEFYLAGAVAGRHTGEVKTTRPTMDGAGSGRGPGEVFRIDTVNDLSLQSVVIWSDSGLIHVVIAATDVNPEASRAVHEERLAAAVAVAGVDLPLPAGRSDRGPVVVSAA